MIRIATSYCGSPYLLFLPEITLLAFCTCVLATDGDRIILRVEQVAAAEVAIFNTKQQIWSLLV